MHAGFRRAELRHRHFTVAAQNLPSSNIASPRFVLSTSMTRSHDRQKPQFQLYLRRSRCDSDIRGTSVGFPCALLASINP